MKSIDKLKKVLLRQQKEVEEDIKSLEKDDPVLADSIAESSEPGTDSWLAEVHGQAVAVRSNLQDILVKIKKALNKMKSGSYGKCDKCGKIIEDERLEAMPTATLCIICSKSAKK